MIRIKRRNNFIAILLLAYCLSFGQLGTSYSYNSFLTAVKDNSPLSQIALNTGEYGSLQLKAARGNYDPLINSNVDNKQFNSKNYFTYGNAEMKQPIYTSHYLKIGYQYGQGSFINPDRYTPYNGSPYLGVEANLLQGLFFDKRRAELIKARHYNDFYTAEQKIELNNLMYNASNLYIELLFTKKTNQLYKYFTELANKRLEGINELAKVGERPTIDTIEASIFLQGRTLEQQSTEIELSKKINELGYFDPTSNKIKISDIVLSDSLEQIFSSTLAKYDLVFNGESSLNPVILQYQAKQKVLETEKRFKKEMIKPMLSLNYNFLSANSENLIPVLNTNNYKWGASFSFPLFFRKSKNEYKMASLDAKNNDLETTNKQNLIDFKKNYIKRTIEINAEQIATATRAASYSKQLFEAEKLKFFNGESSLFILNSRENKWLESELKLAEYKLKFIKCFIELIYLNGTIDYSL